MARTTLSDADVLVKPGEEKSDHIRLGKIDERRPSAECDERWQINKGAQQFKLLPVAFSRAKSLAIRMVMLIPREARMISVLVWADQAAESLV